MVFPEVDEMAPVAMVSADAVTAGLAVVVPADAVTAGLVVVVPADAVMAGLVAVAPADAVMAGLVVVVPADAVMRGWRPEIGNAVWRFICAALDWSLEVGAECMGLCGRKG